MKKLLSLLLAILMVFAFAACGNSVSNSENSPEEIVKNDNSTIGKLSKIWCETMGESNGFKDVYRAQENFYKFKYTTLEKSDGEDIKRVYESENKKYKFTVEYNKAENTLTILDVRTDPANINNGNKTNTTVVKFNAENILVSATKTNEEKAKFDFNSDQLVYEFNEKGKLVKYTPKNTVFTTYTHSSTEYEYDTNDRLVKIVTKDAYIEYVYDENGIVTRTPYKKDYYTEGNPYAVDESGSVFKYQILENGNVKRTQFSEGRVVYVDVYDHYGNTVEKIVYKDDETISSESKCKYNEEGVCIEKTKIDENGTRKIVITYDKDGNEIDTKVTYLDE